MHETFSFLAAGFYLAGFLPFILAIINYKARPPKTSWIIWMILDWIALISMYRSDSLNGQIIVCTAGASISAVLLLKRGTSGWELTDKICLGAAAVAVALLLADPTPTYALVTSLAGILIGAWPTLRGAWQQPENESVFAWAMFSLGCAASLLSVKTWDMQNAAQPVTFALNTLAVVVIAMCRIRTRPAIA